MKLLLDTHTFLWLVGGNPSLSATAQAALAAQENDLYLSAASVWEMAIKVGNKKLSLSEPLDAFVEKWTAAYHLGLLPVQSSHALAIARLAAHHADPFDRLLIAQATVEGMALVTADKKLGLYGVPVVW